MTVTDAADRTQSPWARDMQGRLRADATQLAEDAGAKRTQAADLEREADDLQGQADRMLEAASALDVKPRRGRPPSNGR